MGQYAHNSTSNLLRATFLEFKLAGVVVVWWGERACWRYVSLTAVGGQGPRHMSPRQGLQWGHRGRRAQGAVQSLQERHCFIPRGDVLRRLRETDKKEMQEKYTLYYITA